MFDKKIKDFEEKYECKISSKYINRLRCCKYEFNFKKHHIYCTIYAPKKEADIDLILKNAEKYLKNRIK